MQVSAGDGAASAALRVFAVMLLALGILLGAPGAALAKTYPTTTVSGIPSGWSDADVTFTLYADSTDVAGVPSTWYRLDSGETQEYTGPVTVSAEGTTTLVFWSTTTDCITHEQPITVMIRISREHIAPVSTIAGLPSGWLDAGRACGFSLSASDTGSGVRSTYYRFNGGAPVLYSGGIVPVFASETMWIDYWSQDFAGNVERPKTAVIRVTGGHPITTISGLPVSWSTSDVTFTLVGESRDAAIAATWYRVGDGVVTPYSAPVTVASEGSTTIQFGSVDSLGAREATRSAQISIDRTPPSSSAAGVPAGWASGTVHIVLTGSDSVSGVAGISYRHGGGAWTTHASPAAIDISMPGTTTVEWYATDAAGNAEAVHDDSVSIDYTAPSTSAWGLPSSVATGPVTFTLTSADAHSGVAATYYALDGGYAQPYTGAVRVTKLGTTSLEYWSVDAAGNIEAPHATASFTISAPPVLDTVAPHTTSDAQATYVATATIHLSATDEPGGSGVAHTYFRLDGAAPVEGSSAAVSTLGAHSLEFWSVDVAGNVEAPHNTASVTVNPAVLDFTITASAGTHGVISPSGVQTVVSGASSPLFLITPDAGCHIADVTVDGVSVGAVSSFQFTNVTADHTISATFAINTYTITASAGANGSISPSGAHIVNHGATAAFTITPASGYHIADVLVDGASAGAVSSYAFGNVSANHTIVATFAIDTHTITASAGANGSISPSGAQVVDSGSSRTFTITPDVGFHVADVLVDGASVGAVSSYTFAGVTANHTIAASFGTNAVTTRTITASAGANGSISPSGAQVVDSGSSRTFTITPDVGFHVADVLVDGASLGAVSSYAFTNVTANHAIWATFAIDTYTITASAGANGSISPSGAHMVNHGADASFTITPASGYHIAEVLVDGVSAGAVTSYTFTNVTANHTITATFAADGPTPTSITIKTTTTSTYIGRTVPLSGLVTPSQMIGVNIVVYVMKPGKTYWTYSSNRTVYTWQGSPASWLYKYYFKPGMARGYYRFKARCPAPGFASSAGFATSESPTTVTIRVR